MLLASTDMVIRKSIIVERVTGWLHVLAFCILQIKLFFSCGSRTVILIIKYKMKKFLFLTVALFTMSVSFSFAQTKADIQASVDRYAKLQKLCAKQPKETGVADVDAYVEGVYTAAVASLSSSELLQNLYYRQIGETKDGVTDVSIKKPTVEELMALGETLTVEGVSIAEAAKGAETAIKSSKENKNPMKAAKIATAIAFTTDVYPILLEESGAKISIIKQMIETAKSANNL